MNIHLLAATAAVAAMLGACNASPDTDKVADSGATDNRANADPAAVDPAPASPGNDNVVEPDDGGDDVRDDDRLPDQPKSDDGATIPEIPASFRGRWGLGLSACNNPVQDRDGIMTVTSKEVHFRELRAVATSIEQLGSNRVRLNTDVDRGTDKFTVAMDLVLSDGGRRLTREEEGPRENYVRCPKNSGRLD